MSDPTSILRIQRDRLLEELAAAESGVIAATPHQLALLRKNLEELDAILDENEKHTPHAT